MIFWHSTYSMVMMGGRLLHKRAVLSLISTLNTPFYHSVQCFAGRSMSSQYTVTLDALLSEENKVKSQEKMKQVKPVRGIEHVQKPKKAPEKAAVLVPLCIVNGKPSVLFNVRSSNLYSHRGEVSFPGGKMDKDDKDLVDTALRETDEELGIPRQCSDVWGSLHPVPSKKDFRTMVTPIVAVCRSLDVDDLKINTEEVESVFTQTVESLCDPMNIGYTRFRTAQGYTLPVFSGGEHRIWGLTAVVLHQTLTVIAPGLYNFKLRHPMSHR